MAHHHDNADRGAPAHLHTGGDVHSDTCGCGCGAAHGAHFEETKKEEKVRLLISGVFFLIGYITEEWLSLPLYAALICYAIAYFSVGFCVVRDTIEQIGRKIFFSETFLISVASLGALILREYREGCAVVLLFALGEYIQGAVLAKSRAQIRQPAEDRQFAPAHANSKTERYIAEFARIYTPFICVLALLIAVLPPLFFKGAWQEWLYRGLSALVIGCPCAIVISVPLAFACAAGACARQGIYVHCSNALEALYKHQNTAQDIVVADGDMRKMEIAENAAKKAITITRENIIVALGIKAVILVFVIFLNKEVPMWLAEFSDVGVAVLAVLNALRALRVKSCRNYL